MRKDEILNGLTEIEKSRVVGHNQVRYKLIGGPTILRYTHTDIVIFDEKTGIATLDHGGWMTKATRGRINAELQYHGLCSSNWGPVINLDQGRGWAVEAKINIKQDQLKEKIFFFNGIQVKATDPVSSALTVVDPKPGIIAEKLHKKYNKMIKAYIKKMKKMLAEDGPIMPEEGDCWLCCMVSSKTKKPWGDEDIDHFVTHLEEQYVHGSLILNAHRWANKENLLGFAYTTGEGKLHKYEIDNIAKTVQRYLKAKVGLNY